MRKLSALLVVAGLLVGPGQVNAQVDFCQFSMWNCTNVGSMRQCDNNRAGFLTYSLISVMTTAMMNVTNCSVVQTTPSFSNIYLMFMASANTMSASDRTCSWFISRTVNTGFCDVDMADGLPVELLEFSIDDAEASKSAAPDSPTTEG